MSLLSIPKIHPHRWISLGQKGVKKDWNLFLNTLFWNWNFWDNVSTLAGEVERPQKAFHVALLAAVIFTCVSYLIPLFAVIGAASMDQTEWESGFHATAAESIAGNWQKYWIKVGAVLSAIGLFEAQLTRLPGLIIMCLIPSVFLVLIMVIATKTVYLVSGGMTVGANGWDYLMKFCKSKKVCKFSSGEI